MKDNKRKEKKTKQAKQTADSSAKNAFLLREGPSISV
jgi:hypothetical protein